jgi:hypothetical protein
MDCSLNNPFQSHPPFGSTSFSLVELEIDWAASIGESSVFLLVAELSSSVLLKGHVQIILSIRFVINKLGVLLLEMADLHVGHCLRRSS